MNERLFTKVEMADFVVKWFQNEEPGIRFVPHDAEELIYHVYRAGDSTAIGIMNLRNIWTAYHRSNDINCIIEGLNGQLKGMQLCRKLEEHWDGYRREMVLPTLRPKRYASTQLTESRMLCDDIVPELDTVFCERRDGVVLFIDHRMIAEEDAAGWRESAYRNLRKTGWVCAAERFPALNGSEGGMLQVFYDAPHSFQLQFFLKDMRDGHLPKSFLVGFPSYDTAVVLTADVPITTTKHAQEIAFRSGMISLVRLMYCEERRPLAINLYWVKGKRITCLFHPAEWMEGAG